MKDRGTGITGVVSLRPKELWLIFGTARLTVIWGKNERQSCWCYDLPPGAILSGLNSKNRNFETAFQSGKVTS